MKLVLIATSKILVQLCSKLMDKHKMLESEIIRFNSDHLGASRYSELDVLIKLERRLLRVI